MSSHMRQIKGLKSNNLIIKLASVKTDADKTNKKPKMRSPKGKLSASIELTLDDFGGRSDALGG
jgi:hypothetical protein